MHVYLNFNFRVTSRNFGDIYDIEKFVSSLDGVVKVVKTQPAEISAKNLAVLRIPNRVTEDYIFENIEPVFKSKGNVRLATYFPSVNMKKGESEPEERTSVGCLAMFETLELQPQVREVVDSMVNRLKTLSRKSDSEFVAVDVRLDMLNHKGCQGSKKCFGPQEIALFLKKLRFDKNSAIYLTQSRWDSSLDSVKDLFPKTYTKVINNKLLMNYLRTKYNTKYNFFYFFYFNLQEGIMPMEMKEKFLGSDSSEYEKVIDFYVCAESDVFVPAISGLFYANVVGKRIGLGKTQVLVPDDSAPASASAGKYISRYISKKNHMAYSCFC